MLRRGQVKHTYTTPDGNTVEEILQSRLGPTQGLLATHDLLCNIDKLAIIRDGHLGDVLMLTPTLRQLHSDYPHLDITFFCDPPYTCLTKYIPYFETCSIADYFPFGFDHTVNLRMFVEKHPQSHSVPRVQLFASAFGLQLASGVPDYRVIQDEREQAGEWLAESGVTNEKPLVGFAPCATHWARSMPTDLIRKVARGLAEFSQVLIFHSDQALREPLKGIPSLIFVDNVNLRMAAAIAERCSVMLSVDSGMVHLAAAVQKKGRPFIVAVMSNIPAHLRLGTYSSYRALEPEGVSCFPCFDFYKGACDGRCMESYKPSTIIDTVRMYI